MRTIRRISTGVAAALLAVGMASADTISYSASPSISSTLTDWSGEFLGFQEFNSALGTLNSVTLTLSGTLTTTLTVTNNDGSGSTGTAETDLQISIQDPGNDLTGAGPDATTSAPFTNPPNPNCLPAPCMTNNPMLDIMTAPFGYTLGAGGFITSGPITKNFNSNNQGNGPYVFTAPTTIDEFIGPGTLDMFAGSFTETFLANTGGNTSSSQVTSASLTGTITYGYTAAPVAPEPTTMVLFGSALIGLGCLRKRIRKQ